MNSIKKLKKCLCKNYVKNTMLSLLNLTKNKIKTIGKDLISLKIKDLDSILMIKKMKKQRKRNISPKKEE